MRISSKGLLLFLSGSTLLLFGQEVPRPMRIAVRHMEPGGIGYNQGYTTLEAFFSPAGNFKGTWVPFLDLRGHIFNNGKPAANAGVGVRHVGCHRIWGVNAYYDYRKTKRGHYNQVAAGVESLGKVWDFRLNGYLPLGKKSSGFWGTQFDYFQGNFAFLKSKREHVLKGANAEVAAHISIAKDLEFTFGMGPYYLVGHGATWGGESRVALDLFNYCRVEGFVSYDAFFAWRGQGQLSIIIPFGRPRESCSRARSIQPVERFEIIPVHHKTRRSKAIDPVTGSPYIFLFVNNTSHSLGTFESPFSTLMAAQNASLPGDVIYVFPGDGTTTGMNAGIVLKNHQWLLGAGLGYALPTTVGLVAIPPQANGLPSLTAPSGSPVVTVASNNSISGLQITSNAGYCIGSTAGTTADLFVSENILNANNGATAIIPNEPSGQVIITNNRVQSGDGQGAYAIYLAQTAGNAFYTIQNNTISNFQNRTLTPPNVPTGTGIALLSQDQSVVSGLISGNRITDCVGYGIDCHTSGILSAVIDGNQMQGVPLEGAGILLFSEDNGIATFQVLNNQVDNYPFGIIAQAEDFSSMTGLIQDNILSNGPSGSGLIIEINFLTQTGSATGIFNLVSNTIFGFGDAQGIATASYGSSTLTASIQKNNIYEIGKAGVYVNGFNSSDTYLSIIDNIIRNNNGGVEIDTFDNSIVNVRMQENLITNNNGAALFADPVATSSGRYAIVDNIFTDNNELDLNMGAAVTIIVEDAANVCLQLQNNQATMNLTQPDYDLNNTGSGQFNVEPLFGNSGTISQSGTTPVPTGFCGPG